MFIGTPTIVILYLSILNSFKITKNYLNYFEKWKFNNIIELIGATEREYYKQRFILSKYVKI